MNRKLHTQTGLPLMPAGDAGSGLWLVDELNEMENRAKAERIGQLVNKLKTMIRFARKKQYISHGQMVGSKAISLWKNLNAELADVKLSPYLLPPSKGERLSFHWGDVSGPPEDHSQYMRAVIFNLGAEGLLWRVRQCRNCEKWIYALRSNLWFCNVNCRVSHYQKTPQGRARNREYMRRYRAQPHTKLEGRKDSKKEN
jgi:hypothetical protein